MKNFKSSGFTLIEELIALSLSGIILSMNLLLFSSAMKSYINYKSICRAQEDGVYAIEQIYREVRSSQLGPDCITGTGHGILNLKDPIDPTRTISIKCGMINGRNVLERVVYIGSTSINTRKIIDNVKNIVFEYDCSDNVLNVTLTTLISKGNDSFTIHSKLYSRVGE